MSSTSFAWSFDGSAWGTVDGTSEPGAVDVLPSFPSVPGSPSASLLGLALASLFTDAPVEGQGGGWWADAFDRGQDSDRGPVGSRLWTRARSKLTDELVEQIHRDAVDALAWMVRAGVAVPRVTTTRPTPRAIRLDVRFDQPAVVDQRYAYLWEHLNG